MKINAFLMLTAQVAIVSKCSVMTPYLFTYLFDPIIYDKPGQQYSCSTQKLVTSITDQKRCSDERLYSPEGRNRASNLALFQMMLSSAIPKGGKRYCQTLDW
jgi:hypothetical protein